MIVSFHIKVELLTFHLYFLNIFAQLNGIQKHLCTYKVSVVQRAVQQIDLEKNKKPGHQSSSQDIMIIKIFFVKY